MKDLLDLAVPVLTALLLLAIGLDLTPDQFTHVRRRRGVLAAGLLGPVLVLPALALLLVALFRPSGEVQAGLLLIASCPIGGISNTYSYLARASTALSVTLTAASSLLSVLTMPVLALILGAALGHPLGIAVPLPMIAGQLILLLAIPVGIGMWVRFKRPALAKRVQVHFRALGFGGIAALVLLIVATDPVAFMKGLSGIVPLAAAFVATSFMAGWLLGTASGASASERFTLATEFATRNMAVAAAVALTLAGQLEFALFATTYFLTEIPLMLCAIVIYRRTNRARDVVAG